MSLHLVDYNAIYFHIQKTGGRWVGAALAHSGIKTITNHTGGNKNTFRHVDTKNQFLFTFIRHPVAWYRSFWAQRTEKKWRGDWIDRYKANTFEKFLINILKTKKAHLSKMFLFYIGKPKVLHFVGKTESIRKDLMYLMDFFGVEYSKKKILTLEKINYSHLKPKCSKEIISKVIDLEDEIISMYYKGTPYENYIYKFAKRK